tara:strand:+ start:43695 stop:44009 length:315 start_codon:yes stop_codon:yes gene_type:complete
MSDTPETDAVVNYDTEQTLVAQLCRKIERERDAARAAIQHEREGYECAIAHGYAADAQRERAEKAEVTKQLQADIAATTRQRDEVSAELAALKQKYQAITFGRK